MHNPLALIPMATGGWEQSIWVQVGVEREKRRIREETKV